MLSQNRNNIDMGAVFFRQNAILKLDKRGDKPLFATVNFNDSRLVRIEIF